MAEWSKAAVLKTVEVQASGGSNPSPSVLVCIGAGVQQVGQGFFRIPPSNVARRQKGAMAERSKALPC